MNPSWPAGHPSFTTPTPYPNHLWDMSNAPPGTPDVALNTGHSVQAVATPSGHYSPMYQTGMVGQSPSTPAGFGPLASAHIHQATMGIQRQNQVDQFLNPSPSPSLVDDKQTLALTKIARLFCLKEHLFTPGPYTAILGATVSTDFDPSTRYSIPQDPVEAQDHLLTFFKSDIIATVPSLYQPPLLGKLGMQSFCKTMGSWRSDFHSAVRASSSLLVKGIATLSADDVFLLAKAKNNRGSNPRFEALLGYNANDNAKYPPNCPLISTPQPDDAQPFEGFLRQPIILKVLKLILHGPAFVESDAPWTSPSGRAAKHQIVEVSPGMVAAAAILARILLSPDTEFQAVGGTTKHHWGSDYYQYRRIFYENSQNPALIDLFTTLQSALFGLTSSLSVPSTNTIQSTATAAVQPRTPLDASFLGLNTLVGRTTPLPAIDNAETASDPDGSKETGTEDEATGGQPEGQDDVEFDYAVDADEEGEDDLTRARLAMQVQYRNDDGSDRDDEEEYDGDDDKENASTDRVSTSQLDALAAAAYNETISAAPPTSPKVPTNPPNTGPPPPSPLAPSSVPNTMATVAPANSATDPLLALFSNMSGEDRLRLFQMLNPGGPSIPTSTTSAPVPTVVTSHVPVGPVPAPHPMARMKGNTTITQAPVVLTAPPPTIAPKGKGKKRQLDDDDGEAEALRKKKEKNKINNAKAALKRKQKAAEKKDAEKRAAAAEAAEDAEIAEAAEAGHAGLEGQERGAGTSAMQGATGGDGRGDRASRRAAGRVGV